MSWQQRQATEPWPRFDLCRRQYNGVVLGLSRSAARRTARTNVLTFKTRRSCRGPYRDNLASRMRAGSRVRRASRSRSTSLIDRGPHVPGFPRPSPSLQQGKASSRVSRPMIRSWLCAFGGPLGVASRERLEASRGPDRGPELSLAHVCSGLNELAHVTLQSARGFSAN